MGWQLLSEFFTDRMWIQNIIVGFFITCSITSPLPEPQQICGSGSKCQRNYGDYDANFFTKDFFSKSSSRGYNGYNKNTNSYLSSNNFFSNDFFKTRPSTRLYYNGYNSKQTGRRQTCINGKCRQDNRGGYRRGCYGSSCNRNQGSQRCYGSRCQRNQNTHNNGYNQGNQFSRNSNGYAYQSAKKGNGYAYQSSSGNGYASGSNRQNCGSGSKCQISYGDYDSDFFTDDFFG